MRLRTMLRAIGFVMIGFGIVAASSNFANAQSVPGSKRDLDFDAHMKTVDLDNPSLNLVYKKPTSDGSSIGVFIAQGDKPADASFVPTNTSSIPEAEVVAYRLARFLGVSRIYYPVGYYTLGAGATARFRDMVFGTPEVTNDRITNRKMVMKELEASPNAIFGIYRQKPKTKMYAAGSLGSQGQFNLRSPLARVMTAAGPMPDDEMMALEGAKGGRPDFPMQPTERKVELARQLSIIFTIDQLLGQWDRFWENLEATGDKNGRLKLVARDNGGATFDDWDDFETYNRWVSRYDREVIERLTALYAFLNGETQEFSGFTSLDAWKDAVGFIAPTSFAAFRVKLTLLIEKRITKLVEQYGDETFFPPKSPEVIELDATDPGEDD